MTFAEFIKSKNLPVPQVADELAISQVHVRRLMNFERRPSPKLGQKIIDWSKKKVTYEGLYKVAA